jgi:hypothetical protein
MTLCTSWWSCYESLTLRYPKFWLAFCCTIDLLLDQVVLSVFAILELVDGSWAEICETHRVHLIVAVLAPIGKALLPCDLELGKGWHILVPVFLWLWTSWCLSWAIPSDIRNHQLWMIDLFFAYQHNTSDGIGWFSSSPWSSGLHSRHALVLSIEMLGFLPSNSTIMGFYTAVHTRLWKVPSWCSLHNYCCTKTWHMEDSCPNSCHTSEHKLSTYLLVYGWSFLFDHQYTDDMLS